MNTYLITFLVLGALITGMWLFSNAKKDRVILFHHPSCGHCQAFMPAWAELKQHISLPAKEINCADHPDRCEQYDIEGYPTIILEKNGQKQEFNDKRTVENVIKFIESA